MNRLHEMTVFQTVADAGGFSAAARRLALSTPAVTRAIASLEERLGARLLHRTTRQMQLTEAGERYLSDCRRLLAEIDEADRAAAGVHAEPRGQLLVTASVLFGRLHVAPALFGLLALHRQLTVRTLFVDRVVNLSEEGVDLAVRIGELPDSSLRAVGVGHVRRVLVAAPAYLAEHGRPVALADLANHATIGFTGLSVPNDWRFQVDGQQRQVPVSPQLITQSADVALDAAVADLGLVRLLSYQADAAVRDGRLEILLPAFEPPPLPVHVLHHEGQRVSAKVRAGFDHLVAALRANPVLQPLVHRTGEFAP